MGARVSAEAAAIAREAQMRSEASEAGIAYVTQTRTLRERRGSYIKMVIISALVAVICLVFVVQLVRLGFRFQQAW